MAATFTPINSRDEVTEVLDRTSFIWRAMDGTDPLAPKLEGVNELVYGAVVMDWSKRISHGDEKLLDVKYRFGLRVYTSLKLTTDVSRGVGEDAIRVVYSVRVTHPYRDVQSIHIANTKRVHRTPNWQKNLYARLTGIRWTDTTLLMQFCHCGKPMVVRQSKGVSFWGCSSYPKCTVTRSSTYINDVGLQ